MLQKFLDTIDLPGILYKNSVVYDFLHQLLLDCLISSDFL